MRGFAAPAPRCYQRSYRSEIMHLKYKSSAGFIDGVRTIEVFWRRKKTVKRLFAETLFKERDISSKFAELVKVNGKTLLEWTHSYEQHSTNTYEDFLFTGLNEILPIWGVLKDGYSINVRNITVCLFVFDPLCTSMQSVYILSIQLLMRWFSGKWKYYL